MKRKNKIKKEGLTRKTGIDISTWNNPVDYNALAQSVQFAIMRVGYGVSYAPDSQRDDMLDTHYAGLKGKMPIGAYYYAYATDWDSGVAEAENCIRYMEGMNFELPIFYDLEEARNTREAAEGFIARMRQQGIVVGIYCSTSQYASKYAGISTDWVWLAEWGSNNGQIPSEQPDYAYDIWQYTSNGSAAGVNGRCDLNVAREGVIPEIGQPVPAPSTPKRSNEEIADEVIAGEWGNGDDRKNRLIAAGYDYDAIQDIVNARLLGNKKSNEELADEVIAGAWGNGDERKQRLTEAGYDYDAIQDIVNARLLGGNDGHVYYTVQPGDYLIKIADMYGTTAMHLASINHLVNPSLIYPGQVLLIR